MATPEEVYNSDVYKKAADGGLGNSVPLSWFQDVYEALGKVLESKKIPDVLVTCVKCGGYHSVYFPCPQKE